MTKPCGGTNVVPEVSSVWTELSDAIVGSVQANAAEKKTDC